MCNLSKLQRHHFMLENPFLTASSDSAALQVTECWLIHQASSFVGVSEASAVKHLNTVKTILGMAS